MRIINNDESSSRTGSDEEDQAYKIKNDYSWKEHGGKLDDSDEIFEMPPKKPIQASAETKKLDILKELI